jgi:hypothetical protein
VAAIRDRYQTGKKEEKGKRAHLKVYAIQKSGRENEYKIMDGK